jgi:hypothetical protein
VSQIRVPAKLDVANKTLSPDIVADRQNIALEVSFPVAASQNRTPSRPCDTIRFPSGKNRTGIYNRGLFEGTGPAPQKN